MIREVELTTKEEIPDETWRKVMFVGDYFVLTINVHASDDDQAVENANALLQDHYGWNVGEVSNEITVEDTEQVW
jgi:hypothetical protein